MTSGLDEQTDREMMELFREVAEGGKTVVCITHSLANVEATCTLVVVLTEGGRLAFFGTPDEAKSYFKIPRLGEVYKKLAEARRRNGTPAFAARLLPEVCGRPTPRRRRGLDTGSARKSPERPAIRRACCGNPAC